MNTEPNSQTPKPRRRLLMLLAIALVLFVLFIMLLAGIIVREGLQASVAMQGHQKNESTLRLLEHKAPAPDKHESLPMTSTTLERTQAKPLLFEPLIPNAPDLPEGLRNDRKPINAQFESLLQRIARYEQEKERLTPEQAQNEIAQIVISRSEIHMAVLRQANHLDLPALPRDSALGRISARLMDVSWWYDDARIDIYQRQDKWVVAGNLAEWHLGQRREAWELAQGLNPEGRYEYYRAQAGANDEFHRIIYCYWKQGGVNGYGKILDVALPHYYEKFVDAWKRSDDKEKRTEHAQ